MVNSAKKKAREVKDSLKNSVQAIDKSMGKSPSKAIRKAKDGIKSGAQAIDASLGNSPSTTVRKAKDKAKNSMYAAGESFNKSAVSVGRRFREDVQEIDRQDSDHWRDLKQTSTSAYRDKTPLPDSSSKQKNQAARTDSDSIRRENTSDPAQQVSQPQSRSGTPTLSEKGSDGGSRKERRSKPTRKQVQSGSFLVDDSDNSPVDEFVGEFDEDLAGSFGAFVREPTQAAWRDSVTLGPGATVTTKPSPALSSSSFSRPRPAGSFVPAARPSPASSNRPLTRELSTRSTVGAVQTDDEAVEKWRKKK